MQETPSTKFTDAKGREWDCSLNMGIARRVDDSDYSVVTDLDRWTITSPSKEFFNEILTNRAFAAALVFTIVYPQAKANGYNMQYYDPADPDTYDKAQEDFLEAIKGSTLEAMAEALWRSLIDFFPQQAAVLSMLKRKEKQLREKTDEYILAMEEKLGEDIEESLQREFEKLEKRLENL
jgi:hypothetical protein